MNRTLASDYQVLIDGVREFARGELLPLDRHWDREETSCCQRLDLYHEMGLLGLRVPEQHGGLECPMLPYAHIIRELAYASPSVAVTISVHSMVCELIRQHATPEVREALLPRLAQPGNLCAFAVSEPDAGSDASAVRTRAEPTDAGWRLYGSKFWVTNGMSARWFVVLARTGEADSRRDLTMLLMDGEEPGIQRQLIHGKLGIRGSETCEMALDGVRVPREHLLGELSQGLRVALSGLDGGRIGIASQAVGIAQACFDLMVAYAQQRRQFDRPIADFQAIQWMIADSSTELSAAQLLTDRAALLKDQHSDRMFSREASEAKLFASEAANRIANRAVQVHGGTGYVNESRVEQLFRDARITTIYEGTSEIQRHVIAREVLRGRS